jgi:STE24 endopeptidase
MYAAAAVTALLLVPWDATVAPWADLASERITAFTAEHRNAIEAYVAAVWLPALLAWLAPAAFALVVLIVPPARDALARMGPQGRPVIASVLATAVLLTATRIVSLPLSLWSAQARREAGLLIEPTFTWWLRWLGESLAFVALGSLGVALALAVLRRWPRRGWIAVTAGAGIATLAITALIPFVQRLEGAAADPALTARVTQLAERAGVEVGRVSVIAMGDTTPAINANVSGWGPTRTVTVYDTVAGTATDAEIEALIAHELIHVREGDAVLGAVLATLGAAGTIALVCALALSARVRRRLGALSAGDARLIPMSVAVILAASLGGTIVGATISRPLEVRADREAMALTGDPQAYRSLITTLAVTNRSTLQPPRWRYALIFTHPTPLQRLALLDAAG